MKKLNITIIEKTKGLAKLNIVKTLKKLNIPVVTQNKRLQGAREGSAKVMR